jgi:enoyl-CoA hydratase/carnithine racemase
MIGHELSTVVPFAAPIRSALGPLTGWSATVTARRIIVQLDEISYTIDGAVATITLDRPKTLNAISGRPGGTRDQIVHVLEQAEADPAIGCVVLNGNGRAFCGGGDLTGNTRRETLDEHHAFLAKAAAFHERLTASEIPIIAAVHGFCLGAGVLLAASCDIVIAADDAKFGFPEGRLGLVGAAVLTPVLGRQWAKFLMLTGELVDAATAREIGLVLRVEPADELQARVADLAARIARMPREAARLNRRAIAAVADAGGEATARVASIAHDTETLFASDRATAPDGRTFRTIIDTEGMDGLKQARAAQYADPWLR